MPQISSHPSDNISRSSIENPGVMDRMEDTSSALRALSDKVTSQYEQMQHYLQNADIKTASRDLQTIARRHPVATACVGIGLGFVVGKLLRRH